MLIEIALDGTVLTYGEGYLLEAPLKIVETEAEKTAKMEGEITFIGPAYQLLMARLVDSPAYAQSGLIQGVPLRINDLCPGGGLLFEGEVRADTIDFCEAECFLTATPISTSPDKRFLDALAATYISEPGPIRSGINHPKITYANIGGGDAVNYITMYLISAVMGQLRFLDLFVDAVRTLADVLTFGIFRRKLARLDLSPAKDALNKAGTGLAYFHPAPYLRDYINESIALANQRAGTNFRFQSSVYGPGGPLQNLAYLYSDYERGLDLDFNDLDAPGLLGREPLVAAGDLLDQLAQLCNGKWRIRGAELVLERKDRLERQGADLSGYHTCYNLRDAPLPAAFELKFADDAQDIEASSNGYYDYFKLWNQNPHSVRQKGVQAVNLPFGRSRQLYDKGADYSATGKSLNFRAYAVTELAFRVIYLLGNLLSGGKVSRLQRDQAPLLAMDTGRTSAAKLLDIGAKDPFWGHLVNDFNKVLTGKALYDNYYSIDDPRGAYMRSRRPLTFNIEELPMGDYKIYDLVKISRGAGRVMEIETEIFPDRKVAIRGEM
jgi:hypothetical protein